MLNVFFFVFYLSTTLFSVYLSISPYHISYLYLYITSLYLSSALSVLELRQCILSSGPLFWRWDTLVGHSPPPFKNFFLSLSFSLSLATGTLTAGISSMVQKQFLSDKSLSLSTPISHAFAHSSPSPKLFSRIRDIILGYDFWQSPICPQFYFILLF